MRISDWSSDVCSSDLCAAPLRVLVRRLRRCGGVPEGQVQDQRQRHRLLLALQERRKSRAFALLLQERPWRESQAGPGLPLSPGDARNRATPSHEWRRRAGNRSEEPTSELQSLMRITYAHFSLNKK